MLGSRGIQAVCGMLVSMLLARMLAPGDLGTYFILTSITLLGSMLAQFGTHHSIVKLIADGMARGDEAGVRRSLRSVLLIAVCGSAVVAGGYLAGVGQWLADHVFRSQGVALLAGLTAAWIVMRHGQMLLSRAFRGFHDMRHAALYEGAQTQLLTVIVLAMLWFATDKTTLDRAVQATLVALGITLLSGAWLLWRHHWSRLAPARGLSIGPTLRLSAPLFVSSTSLLALGEMHLWILGYLSTPEQVAIYGAGYRLVMLVSLPLTLVNHVIPPMVAELFTRQRKAELERLLRSTASMIALPALLLLTLLLVFAGDLLRLVYGDFFRAGAPVLAIMAAGQAINVWTGSPGVLLSMSDQQGRLMHASVGGGMVGLLITLLLARDFGATGVAAGYASGLAIQNVAMAWIAWRRLGIRTYAGIGQFRDAWFWLRGEQARRAQRGGIVCLHRAYAAARGKPVLRPGTYPHRRVLRWSPGPPVFIGQSLRVRERCLLPLHGGSDPNGIELLAITAGALARAGHFSGWLSRIPPGRSLIFIPGAQRCGADEPCNDRAWRRRVAGVDRCGTGRLFRVPQFTTGQGLQYGAGDGAGHAG